MKVTPMGQGLSYWVSSADDKEPYMVVLDENKGLPVCTCPDMRCKCNRLIDETRKIRRYGYTNRTICKHIDAAMFYFAAQMLARITGKEVDEIYEQQIAKWDK
jgi:hypothetical protein